MTEETSLKKTLKDYLNIKHIFWWYCLAGMGAYPGVPDLFAMKEGMIYGIEVKSSKGHQSEMQKVFEERFRKSGGIYILARSLEDVRNFL